MQRGFDPLTVRNVFLDSDKVSNGARFVAKGCDGGRFPKQRAILAAVVKFAAPLATGGDGSPQMLVVFPWCSAGPENAGIGTDHLGFGIAGDLDEFGIDVLNGAFLIGDHHQVGALFDGARKKPQLPFGLSPFLDLDVQMLPLLVKIINQPG